MNIIRAVALFALVLVLAGCRAFEVPDNATARLEIQIISSLSDNESIDRLDVVGEGGGVLYSVSDFANRFHALELARDRAYVITAHVNVNDRMTQKGSVSLTREVTLGATTENVVLDLRLLQTPRLTIESGTHTHSVVLIHIPKNQGGESASTSLTFAGGLYSSYITPTIDTVSARFGAGGVRWSTNSVTITPEVFGEGSSHPVHLEIHYSGIHSAKCGSIGHFDLSWESKTSKLNRRVEVVNFCSR